MKMGLEQKAIGRDSSKRQKAKELRYKKPIVKNLNLESIKQELFDIQEQCEEVNQLKVKLEEYKKMKGE